MESRKTTYSSWKEKHAAYLEGIGKDGHSQNEFYGNLLFKLLEEKLSDKFAHIMVDDQFEQFFNDCADRLRQTYGYKLDEATIKGSESNPFNDFIEKLEENEYISSSEIKKNAQHFYDSMHLFTFEEIKFNSTEGHHVKLNTTKVFNEWFNQIPIKKPIPLKDGFVIFKIDENTIAINKGQNTPGIQLQRKDTSFSAYNNFTADTIIPSQLRDKNLKTMLLYLHCIMSEKNIADLSAQTQTQVSKYQEPVSNERKSSFWVNEKNIADLSAQIQTQISKYQEFVSNERKSSIWVNERKIGLWQDKIAVLTVANLILQGNKSVSVTNLKSAESLHPRWSEGKEAKALVEKVKVLKEIPLTWEKNDFQQTNKLNK